MGTSVVAQMVESACNAGDMGSIPASGRSFSVLAWKIEINTCKVFSA